MGEENIDEIEHDNSCEGTHPGVIAEGEIEHLLNKNCSCLIHCHCYSKYEIYEKRRKK